MARMPIYQETGAPAVTPITPPTVDQAGLRMQTAGYTNLAEASQRVVDFALAEKTRQSEVAGAAEGARNPFGVLDELEGKVLPTAYDRSALDTATRFAVAKIGNSTELQILTAISDAQENGLDPADLNARISGIISGASDATGSVSPDAAGALMMELRSYAAANSLQYQGNYLKLQEAENLDEWKVGVPGVFVEIASLVRQGNLEGANNRLKTFEENATDLGIDSALITEQLFKMKQEIALANVETMFANADTFEQRNEIRELVFNAAYGDGRDELLDGLNQTQIESLIGTLGNLEAQNQEGFGVSADQAMLMIEQQVRANDVDGARLSLEEFERQAVESGVSPVVLAERMLDMRAKIDIAHVETLFARALTIEDKNKIREMLREAAYGSGESNLVDNLSHGQVRALITRLGNIDLSEEIAAAEAAEAAADEIVDNVEKQVEVLSDLARGEIELSGVVTPATMGKLDTYLSMLPEAEAFDIRLRLNYEKEIYNYPTEIPNNIIYGNPNSILDDLNNRYNRSNITTYEQGLIQDAITRFQTIRDAQLTEFNEDQPKYIQDYLQKQIDAGIPAFRDAAALAIDGDSTAWLKIQEDAGLPLNQQTIVPVQFMSMLLETILSGEDPSGAKVDGTPLVGYLDELTSNSPDNLVLFQNAIRLAGGNDDLALAVELYGETGALAEIFNAYVWGTTNDADAALKDVVPDTYTSVDDYRNAVREKVFDAFEPLFQSYISAGADQGLVTQRATQFTNAVMTALARDGSLEPDNLIKAMVGHFSNYEFYDGAVEPGDRGIVLYVSSDQPNFRLPTELTHLIDQITDDQNSISAQIDNGQVQLTVPPLVPQLLNLGPEGGRGNVRSNEMFPEVTVEMSELELGLVKYHREQLTNGTYLDDDQGMTSVNIMGVTGPNGDIYNVPGFADGRRLTEQEAFDNAAAMGWDNFQSYPADSTVPNDEHPANLAAQRIHEQIDIDGQEFLSVLNEARRQSYKGWTDLVIEDGYWGNVDDGTLRLFLEGHVVLDANGNFIDIAIPSGN